MVPAHNEAATIEQTVRSCLHQTYPVAQVIVVADNCTDPTAILARAAGATVIEGSGGSKASAQNLALPHVAADLVVALDGDNTLDARAVAHLVATMRAGHAGTCASVLPKGWLWIMISAASIGVGINQLGVRHCAVLRSGLVHPPNRHRSDGHVVAGAGMGTGPSPDRLDRPPRTPPP